MEKGTGWLLFAWLMMLTAGVMSIIDGIVGLSQSSFFTETGSRVVFSDLKTWAWVVLILGILQLTAAASVYRGGSFGRWYGIGMAIVSLIVWLSWIPIYPFWALTVMVIDVLVIYALAVYGGDYESRA